MTRTVTVVSIGALAILLWLSLTVPGQIGKIESMLEHKTDGTVLRLSTEVDGTRVESETTARPGETREDLTARALADLAELVRQLRSGG